MTTPVVLDASLAFRLLLPGPDQATIQQRVAGWQEAGIPLLAPALWLYELTSALCKAVHLGALQDGEAQRALALALGLGVELILPDAAQAALAYRWTLRLRRAAAYDSFYLSLAESLQAELWTADQRLQAAAAEPWVHLA
jgi:predicted nucleic acid-binding protein